jgi:hypothetical protein
MVDIFHFYFIFSFHFYLLFENETKNQHENDKENEHFCKIVVPPPILQKCSFFTPIFTFHFCSCFKLHSDAIIA